MSTPARRPIAKAAVTQQPRRVFAGHWAEMAILAVLAGALLSGKVAQTGFAQELVATASSELQAFGEQWLNARKWLGPRRSSSTSGRVECISDYDPYWEARDTADRVESGSRIVFGCLQVRIARD